MSSSGTISRRPTLPLPLPSSLPFPPFFAFSHIPLSRHKPPPTNDVTLRCKAVIDKRDILICDKATDSSPSPSVRPCCSQLHYRDRRSCLGDRHRNRRGRQQQAFFKRVIKSPKPLSVRRSAATRRFCEAAVAVDHSDSPSSPIDMELPHAPKDGRTGRRVRRTFFIVPLAVAAELQSDGLTRFAAFCSPSLDGRAV